MLVSFSTVFSKDWQCHRHPLIFTGIHALTYTRYRIAMQSASSGLFLDSLPFKLDKMFGDNSRCRRLRVMRQVQIRYLGRRKYEKVGITLTIGTGDFGDVTECALSGQVLGPLILPRTSACG